MIKKSFSASLVGIKYQNPPFNVYETIKSESISLRRDKNNQHDLNAVEVVIRGYKVGFVDRESASIFAPLLDSNYSSQVTPKKIDSNLKSIKIDVSFFIPEVSVISKPVLASVAGIYEISVNKREYVYIGQSIDIKNRISTHWDELQFNAHKNKKLQSLWNTRGSSLFEASVVEVAPIEIKSELARQRWLAEREIYWIKLSREMHNCINVLDGEFVPTKNAVKEFEREEKQFIKEHDEKMREKKEALKTKLNQADLAYIACHKRVGELEAKLKEMTFFVRSNTGIWGFLTGAKHRARALEMKPQIEIIFTELNKEKDAMQKAYSFYSELKNDYSKLKTHKQIERELDKFAYKMGTTRTRKKIR